MRSSASPDPLQIGLGSWTTQKKVCFMACRNWQDIKW